MMKKDNLLKGVNIVCLLFVFVAPLFPWIEWQDKNLTILQFYRNIILQGGVDQLTSTDGSVYILTVFLAFPPIVGLLSGLKAILLTANKSSDILSYTIYLAELIYVASFLSFSGYMWLPAAIISACLTGVEFLLQKYMQQYKQFTKEWEQEQKRKEQQKKEIHERLYFPGHYSPACWRIVLKATLHRKTSVFIIMLGNVVLLMYLFILMSIKNILQKGYSVRVILPSEGLNVILKNSVIMIVVLYAVFEVIALFYNTRSNAMRESILSVLGIRNAMNRNICVLEYSILIAIPMLIGLVLGTVGFLLIAHTLFPAIAESTGILTWKIYVFSVGIYLLISASTVLIFYRTYRGETINDSYLYGFLKRKLSKNKSINVIFGLGTVLLLFWGMRYGQRRYAENIFILLAIVCSIILLFWSVRAKRSIWCRKKIRYLLKDSGIQASLYMLHFIFMGIAGIQIAGHMCAPPAENLFPYDYVCIGYEEDKDIFTEISERNLADVWSFPMCRVTAVQGEATNWVDYANNYYAKVIWPQGQHIGISWSTYIQLCQLVEEKVPNNVNLEDGEIYIAFQESVEEKAHPLDWYMNRKEPNIHIGQPLDYYSVPERGRLYPDRAIAGETRNIVTGAFHNGAQENLVVFSDSYFEKIQNTEGPSVLYLLQEQGETEELEQILEHFSHRHIEDASWDEKIQSVYSKDLKSMDLKSERFMKLTVYIFVLILDCLIFILMVALKLAFEQKERQKKYQLFFVLGMRHGQCKKMLQKELIDLLAVPFILAYATSMVISVITGFLRMMTQEEWLQFLGNTQLLACIYLAVNLVVGIIFYMIVSKKTLSSGG